MPLNDNAPFTVLGGGIVGLCAALHLVRSGLDVLLVDPGDLRRAASFGNGGQLALGEVIPLSTPDLIWSLPRLLWSSTSPLKLRWRDVPAMTPWLLRFLASTRKSSFARTSAAMADLGRRIHADYQPLIRAADAGDLISDSYSIRLYRSRDDWQAEKTWPLRVRAGLDYAEMDRTALDAAQPGLGPEYRFGVEMKGRSFIRSLPKFLERLRTAFVAGGGRVIPGEAVDFDRSDGQVTHVVLTTGERLAVGGVLIAAGAWSKPLAGKLGDALPLGVERGYHFVLPDPRLEMVRSVTDPAKGIGLTPMAEGLRMSGLVEIARLGSPPDDRFAARLLGSAQEIMPGLNICGAVPWMGNRPSFPDSLPVIDRARRCGNVWYAFGHGHMGVSWAATTAKVVTELIQNRVPTIDLSPFRAARF